MKYISYPNVSKLYVPKGYDFQGLMEALHEFRKIVLHDKYKNNFDIGTPSLRYFDEEVKKYSYMWRENGQFSTDRYRSKEN